MGQAAFPVSAIVVSWNVLPLLRRCLCSLLAQHPPPCAVVVVDNASRDGSPEAVLAEYPGVRLFEAGGNLGFAAGLNAGFRASGRPYLLALNPDAELRRGALAAMLRLLERDPQIAVVAPRLLYPTGEEQPSRRGFPSRLTLFLESTPLQRIPGADRLLRRFYAGDRPSSHVQTVDWAVGACLLLRASALAEVGGLDEGYFMYSEEVDLCRRLGQLGWQVAYEPAAVVVHHEAKSSDQAPTARLIRFNRAKVRYAAKHFGRGCGGALRLYLLGTFLLQGAEEGAKLLLGRNPVLRRERLASYRAVLAGGLRLTE